jgi:dTMP kinase
MVSDYFLFRMNERSGQLIVFEGIDGTGKTTQLERAALWLESLGFPVVRLREPTESPHGLKLRQSAHTGRLQPQDELELFLADRAWNVEHNLRPNLDAGKIVLLDRYFFSTIAYQGARGLEPAMIRRRNEEIALPPDLVLLFDMDAEKALLRIERQRGENPNLFEKLDYLRKVRDIFMTLKDPCIWRIDAGLEIEQVWLQIKNAIGELLKLSC